MITPCFKKFRSSRLDLCFLLHVSICGVSGHARVKCPGSFVHRQSSQEETLNKYVEWRSHDAICCKILRNPHLGKSGACLCTVSASYVIMPVLQKPSWFLLSSHYGVPQKPLSAAAVHSWTDDCEQKQWNPPHPEKPSAPKKSVMGHL